MSLTDFVKLPDVRDMLKPFRPPPPRKIDASIKVKHRATKDHISAICTAFDYLLRFELERRVPHCIRKNQWSNGSWIAENAPTRIELRSARIKASIGRRSARIISSPFGIHPDRIEGVVATIKTTLANARHAWKAYVGKTRLHRNDKMKMATYAIKLAKLDLVTRPGILPPDFDAVDSESTCELLDLLAIVPWHKFVNSKMILNPTFQGSLSVGGADGDLITDDMLVDFKTTIKDVHNIYTFDQLLGYFLLANHFPSSEHIPLKVLSIAKINRVGIYYGRHGYLWSLPTSFWTEHVDFPKLKKWFFERANMRDNDPLPKRAKPK